MLEVGEDFAAAKTGHEAHVLIPLRSELTWMAGEVQWQYEDKWNVRK